MSRAYDRICVLVIVFIFPTNVASMNPPEDGSSVISLQTCTLPDYSERIIVRGELVEGDAV